MNSALNILSAASGGVIDRLQSYTANGSQSIAQQQLSDPDYWGSVFIITLTGLLIVFFILAILIFFFWIMGTVFKSIAKKKEDQTAVVQTPAPVTETMEEFEEEQEDDSDEIAAVIAAAVAAFSEQDGKTYVIKDIKRKNDRAHNAWRFTGIRENTRPF